MLLNDCLRVHHTFLILTRVGMKGSINTLVKKEKALSGKLFVVYHYHFRTRIFCNLETGSL